MIGEAVRVDWSVPTEGVAVRDGQRRSEAECRIAMLAALAEAGEPLSAGELARRTGFSEMKVGTCGSMSRYFIRQRRYLAGTRGEERVLIAPHPDLARHYPKWAARLPLLMAQVGR